MSVGVGLSRSLFGLFDDSTASASVATAGAVVDEDDDDLPLGSDHFCPGYSRWGH